MTLWIRADLAGLFGALDFEQFLALGEHTVRVGPDGARRTAWFERAGRRFYLKVHTGVGWGEIAKCLLQGKRPILDALPEVRALERLSALGIPAPELCAYGMRGRDPARRRSFVLTEDLARTQDLGEFLAGAPALAPRFRQALARELGRLVGKLHAGGLVHQDLYLTHFRLRRGAGDAFELYLIDLHRAGGNARRARAPEGPRGPALLDPGARGHARRLRALPACLRSSWRRTRPPACRGAPGPHDPAACRAPRSRGSARPARAGVRLGLGRIR